jgi:hypothetical protein
MKEFEEILLKAVREVLKVRSDFQDPAIEWLANAVMISLGKKGFGLTEGIAMKEPRLVYEALERFRDVPTSILGKQLREALVKFKAEGGRGIELSDDIDAMTVVLAIRRETKTPYAWHGPREWSPK